MFYHMLVVDFYLCRASIKIMLGYTNDSFERFSEFVAGWPPGAIFKHFLWTNRSSMLYDIYFGGVRGD